MGIKHAKQDGLPADDGSSSHVRPSDWYAEHVITGMSPAFIGCSVSNSATVAMNNGSYTVMTFDTEAYDTDGFHSTVTNTSRLTIPAGMGGKYLMEAVLPIVQGAGAVTDRRLSFYKNGSGLQLVERQYWAITANGTAPYVHGTYVGDLAAGDYIEVAGYVDNTGCTMGAGSQITLSKLDSGKVGNGIGCKVYKTTQTVTDTVLAFDSEDFDTDGFHSTVTNTSRITIPAGLGGIYIVHFNAWTDATARVAFKVDGSETTIRGRSASSPANNYVSMSTILSLSPGQYVEIGTHGTSKIFGDAGVSGDYAWFSIMRLDSGSSNLVVEEADGSPSSATSKLVVPSGMLSFAGTIATFMAGFKIISFTVGQATTAYIPDADVPRLGAAIFVDDGNSGAGILMWYRQGTFNALEGVATSSHGYEFRHLTLSGGSVGFSWFIENNNTGGRIGCKNNNASYGRTFRIIVFAGA